MGNSLQAVQFQHLDLVLLVAASQSFAIAFVHLIKRFSSLLMIHKLCYNLPELNVWLKVPSDSPNVPLRCLAVAVFDSCWKFLNAFE